MTDLGDRSKYLGGSDMAAVMGVSPYKSRYQLWLEKTGRVEAKDISGLPHVRRGIEGEVVAREMIEAHTGTNFEPSAWKHDLYDFLVCHDDGYDEKTRQILEIKCMGKADHEKCFKEQWIPEHYKMQLQFNMMLSNAEKGLFVSFVPESRDVVIVHMSPDDKLQAELLEKAVEFWCINVQKDIEPIGLGETDYLDMTANAELEAITHAYAELDKKIKEFLEPLETEKELLREKIHNIVKDKRVKTSGLLMYTTTVKGGFDENKLKQLGVDLSHYRKPESKRFTIKRV